MDGHGFDAWNSQPSASNHGGRAGLDLNSQVPAAEGFLGLNLYGAFLQGDDDDLLHGGVGGSRLPPYRPQRAGSGDGGAPPPPPTRQLNFGASFVLSGWPGSAHDMRVFKDAMTTYYHKFPHPPPGKFYVVDAGYPNRPGYLSPYRCIRYHVEQWQNGPPPRGMKGTFNYAHAKVRNVIERSFGVLKMKFRILLNMPTFPEEKQTRIIVACMALHNFIRESRIVDREFYACDADENYTPMPIPPASVWPQDEPIVEDFNMNTFRDELAQALFHGV